MREHPGAYNDYHFDCSGIFTFENNKIQCYHKKAHGSQDFTQAFANSCNGAFANLGTELELTSYRNLAEQLLFNRSLPLDIPYNKSTFSMQPDAETWEVLQTSIGQGQTLVTPLQNILLVCASVNGGELMQPYVVDRIEDANGNTVSENAPKSLGKKMSEKEAKQLKKLMRGTVKGGTATSLYYGTPYKAGGKTGSAEFQNGSTDSHAWFVGYAEKNGKKICVSVVVEAAGTGSAYAVPIAKKVFDAYW